MSWLLRSTKTKLLYSSSSFSSSLSRTFPSLPRPTHDLPQIGALSPLPDVFHRNTATMPIRAKENASGGNLTGLPRDPANELGSDSNAINSSRYKAFGLDTSVLAGARYGTRVWAAQSPMLLGVNTVMARSFERGMEADTLGMIGYKRFMSDIPSKTSETNPSGFRPLSPHLPLYQPQLSSTLSIVNRIAGAFLATVILLFYMIYMKMGLVSLTYDSFYQFIFYSSKLNLLAIEISALAVSYHLYSAIRHLFL
ncbi:Succinate dehydrogenase subunit 3-2 [Spatholobus suberectus]|nr:Succinate dehydrogenase subunit 3-2 [Spatholobus suberectus]